MGKVHGHTGDDFGHVNGSVLGDVGKGSHGGHEVSGADVVGAVVLEELVKKHIGFLFEFSTTCDLMEKEGQEYYLRFLFSERLLFH